MSDDERGQSAPDSPADPQETAHYAAEPQNHGGEFSKPAAKSSDDAEE
jgi:hypothetical protein